MAITGAIATGLLRCGPIRLPQHVAVLLAPGRVVHFGHNAVQLLVRGVTEVKIEWTKIQTETARLRKQPDRPSSQVTARLSSYKIANGRLQRNSWIAHVIAAAKTCVGKPSRA